MKEGGWKKKGGWRMENSRKKDGRRRMRMENSRRRMKEEMDNGGRRMEDGGWRERYGGRGLEQICGQGNGYWKDVGGRLLVKKWTAHIAYNPSNTRYLS